VLEKGLTINFLNEFIVNCAIKLTRFPLLHTNQQIFFASLTIIQLDSLIQFIAIKSRL